MINTDHKDNYSVEIVTLKYPVLSLSWDYVTDSLFSVVLKSDNNKGLVEI